MTIAPDADVIADRVSVTPHPGTAHLGVRLEQAANQAEELLVLGSSSALGEKGSHMIDIADRLLKMVSEKCVER